MNISHLDKADVLAALYNHAKAQGMGYIHYTLEPMTHEQAHALIERTPDACFDYLQGRVFKVNLSWHELDEKLYDRDNGQGAAQRAIASIEQTGGAC